MWCKNDVDDRKREKERDSDRYRKKLKVSWYHVISVYRLHACSLGYTFGNMKKKESKNKSNTIILFNGYTM